MLVQQKIGPQISEQQRKIKFSTGAKMFIVLSLGSLFAALSLSLHFIFAL
jgi:hypothetical protein